MSVTARVSELDITAEVAESDDTPSDSVSCIPPVSKGQLGLKRLIDVVGATIGLALAVPVGVMIACLISLTSRGPVFFVQQRVGQGGKPFRLIKFRTMRDGTHDEVLASFEERRRYESNGFKLPSDDHRITAVGRVLRSTSLDELPQLLNVLRGEMSLVGVRPLLARELASREPYDQELYFLLRPGLTGLWQVAGRSTVGDDDRRELDRMYVETWTLGVDIKILTRTPAAVLRFEQSA